MHAVKKSTLGKVVTGVIAFAFVVSAYAPTANAQTADELQSQIASLLAQIAALQSQLGTQGGTTTSGLYCNFSFLRDLSSGSTGSDVMDLQKFLNSAGFTVSTSGAGSAGMETTYYGPATAAAVSRFQVNYSADILAPLGLTSGTGYWGASSRAKANQLCAAAPTTPGSSDDDDDDVDSDDLSGGEADLGSTKTLKDPRNEEVSEGEEEVPVLGVEFDVDGGDISIRRVDVKFEETGNAGDSDEPWDYFDEIHLMDADQDVVASVRADRKSDWDRNGDVYSLRFTGLNIRVDEGDTAELYIAVSTRGVIDSADEGAEWTVTIPLDGIRIVDAAGINQYAGDNNSQSLTIDQPATGELDIAEGDDNPESAILAVKDDGNSDEYTVLVAEFQTDDEDILVEDITVRATSTTTNLDKMVRSVTLVIDGTEYPSDEENDSAATGTYTFEEIDHVFDADEDIDVAVVVEFQRADGTVFKGDGSETIQFGIYKADIKAETESSGEDATVEGEAIGNAHTLMTFGIIVDNGSTSAEATNTETLTLGTYTLTFDVTALGEDIYIYDSVGTTSADGIQIDILKGNADANSDAGTFVGTITSDDADERTNSWRVRAGRTATFEVTVTWDPAAQGSYAMELDKIEFLDSDSATEGDYKEAQVPDVSQFQTKLITIAGNS